MLSIEEKIADIGSPRYYTYPLEEEDINATLVLFLGYKPAQEFFTKNYLNVINPVSENIININAFTRNLFSLCYTWDKLRSNHFKISFQHKEPEPNSYSCDEPLNSASYECITKIIKPSFKKFIVVDTSMTFAAAKATSLVVAHLQNNGRSYGEW